MLPRFRRALTKAADRGVRGVLLQVLDPAEEAFPFRGRTIFESMGGTLAHETLKAGELREPLSGAVWPPARPSCNSSVPLPAGNMHCIIPSDSAQSALLWLYRALERGLADDRIWPASALPRLGCCWAAGPAAHPVDHPARGAACADPAALSGRGASAGAEGRRTVSRTARHGGCCCCGCWRWRR